MKKTLRQRIKGSKAVFYRLRNFINLLNSGAKGLKFKGRDVCGYGYSALYRGVEIVTNTQRPIHEI